MAAYPDRPEQDEYYVRDYIAPRFYALNMSQYKWGLIIGNLDLCREMLVDMRKFSVLAGSGLHIKALLAILKYPALVRVVLKVKTACVAPAQWLLRSLKGGASEKTEAS